MSSGKGLNSHIYIAVPCSQVSTEAIRECQLALSDIQGVEICAHDSLHISLSRTFHLLPSHAILFRDRLKKIKQELELPFPVRLSKFRQLPSDDNSVQYLTLVIGLNRQRVTAIIH